MADLLTATDRAEIRAAIQDVFDTYMKKSATLIIRDQGETLTAFVEGIDSHKTPVEYNILVLYLPATTDQDSEAMKNKTGYFDDSEGVVFIPVSTLKAQTPPLWTDGQGSKIEANRDTIVVDGNILTIMGVNDVGPDEESFFMVKLHYFNTLKKKGVGES